MLTQQIGDQMDKFETDMRAAVDKANNTVKGCGPPPMGGSYGIPYNVRKKS